MESLKNCQMLARYAVVPWEGMSAVAATEAADTVLPCSAEDHAGPCLGARRCNNHSCVRMPPLAPGTTVGVDIAVAQPYISHYYGSAGKTRR